MICPRCEIKYDKECSFCKYPNTDLAEYANILKNELWEQDAFIKTDLIIENKNLKQELQNLKDIIIKYVKEITYCEGTDFLQNDGDWQSEIIKIIEASNNEQSN